MAKKKTKTAQDSVVLDMNSYNKMSENIESKEGGDNPSIASEPVWDEKNTSEEIVMQSVLEDNEENVNIITINKSALGGAWNASKERVKKYVKAAWKKIKKGAGLVFIDGMTGMALGLFATLIIGTIISQVGKYVGDNFIGIILNQIGIIAKFLMGAGIGIGVALKFKKPPLLVISAGVAGLIGAQATTILNIANKVDGSLLVSSPGEPVCAVVAALVAVAIGGLVVGKTKIDIIITPLVAILAGAVAGLLIGAPIAAALTAIGNAIEWAMKQNTIIMGIVISVLMGIALTAPISSAALGISLKLSGLAAGAAAVGCCSQMIGFAVASFRENKWGGLAAQGIGTSMLQMPNIMKKPIIWLPAIITSAILGPISSAVFGMTNNAIGSGMGTAGLVGPIMAFETMVAETKIWYVLLQIGLMHFLLPAVLCLAISELMRKVGLIKHGDMKLAIT